MLTRASHALRRSAAAAATAATLRPPSLNAGGIFSIGSDSTACRRRFDAACTTLPSPTAAASVVASSSPSPSDSPLHHRFIHSMDGVVVAVDDDDTAGAGASGGVQDGAIGRVLQQWNDARTRSGHATTAATTTTMMMESSTRTARRRTSWWSSSVASRGRVDGWAASSFHTSSDTRSDASPSPSPSPSPSSTTAAAKEETTDRDDNDNDNDEAAVIRPPGDRYEAALAETVRNVKILSLASLAATVCGTPLLLELASPDMVYEARLTVCLLVDGFGTFTTALLQWFVSPYVLRMRMLNPSTVEVEKLNILGSVYVETFPVDSMREAETTRPLVTWEAEGGNLHYVEMGLVPQSLYDGLRLERFDVQAQAEKEAREAKKRGDNKDDDDDDED